MMARRTLYLASSALLAATLTPPALAQTATTADQTRRIERIERELRAVQRRVFPGSENGLFQPEVDSGTPTPAPTTPVATLGIDLSARLDAIEAQVARLTGEVEQTGFRQREMAAEIARLRAEMEARLSAAAPAAADTGAPGTPAPAAAPTPAPAAVTPRPTPAPAPATGGTTPRPTPAPTVTPAPRPTPAPAPAASTTQTDQAALAERRRRVAAVAVPSTGDAPEDAYIYGFRLWEARLYPEAVLQLQKVIDEHPNHRRASYAGNLMGRALLDNNQPSLAVRAFYDNYRNRPRGERAAESVYYMGMALIRLDRDADACRTFDEFDRAYGASASEALKAQVRAGRGQAGC